MKQHYLSFKKIILFIFLVGLFNSSIAQLPSKVLVGYWHNWNQTSIPFIKLSNVDSRYNVICLSFAGASGGSISSLGFNMWSGSSYGNNELISEIAAERAKGKVILMSIGGANGSFKLSTVSDKDVFVTKMKDMISLYKVNGIDIDLEQTNYVCMSSGSISSPQAHIKNLIDGVKELRDWYLKTFGKKMILTLAPETVYVNGGLSQWADCGGSYLPFIEALRNDIDLMMIQLYNSGSMFDLNLSTHSQGTTGFVVSQTEAAIKGFTHAKGWGTYSGLPASKIAVALPSCSQAGSGALSAADAKSAVQYLLGKGPKVGTYTLKQSGGYPDLRGMMTWSINNDALASCGGSKYAFAANFESIFGTIDLNSTTEVNLSSFALYPNPANNLLNIEKQNSDNELLRISNINGQVVLETIISAQKSSVSIEQIPSGFYIVSIGGFVQKLVKN